MPTFKTEALRLISNVQLVKGLLLCNEQQIYKKIILLYFGSNSQMHFVTKAPPINGIDSK